MVTLPTETPGCQLLLRRLVVGRDTFSPLAPALGLQLKTLAMLPFTVVSGGQYVTNYVTFEYICTRCS